MKKIEEKTPAASTHTIWNPNLLCRQVTKRVVCQSMVESLNHWRPRNPHAKANAYRSMTLTDVNRFVWNHPSLATDKSIVIGWVGGQIT